MRPDRDQPRCRRRISNDDGARAAAIARGGGPDYAGDYQSNIWRSAPPVRGGCAFVTIGGLGHDVWLFVLSDPPHDRRFMTPKLSRVLAHMEAEQA